MHWVSSGFGTALCHDGLALWSNRQMVLLLLEQVCCWHATGIHAEQLSPLFTAHHLSGTVGTTVSRCSRTCGRSRSRSKHEAVMAAHKE